MKTKSELLAPGLAFINAEQSLYVLPCGDGYSCLGFQVAEKWRAGVLAWMGERTASQAPLGTVEAFQAYEAAMAAGAAHARATGKRCPALLTPALIPHEGRRVEVKHPDGERERFHVGKSTGWLPIHLAIMRKGDSGGLGAYVPDGSTVRRV